MRYRHFINHEKVCDLDLKVSKEVGVGMEQHKILDQYRTSGIVSTRSIQRFKGYPVLKTFNQKLQSKISKSVTLTARLVRGWGWCSIIF